MPVYYRDIQTEIDRRRHLAAVAAEVDRRSRDRWPRFRGAAAELFSVVDTPGARHHEMMISGPAETGKTFAALWVLDYLMREYPGAQATIARKLRATMDGTVLNTWRRVIAIRGGVSVYGGESPQWYDYPNGSRVWIAGLDNPGKALSAERDFVYVNQAEDLTLDDWQTLTTRTTGRGAVAPFTMLFGDCNPGPPTHWILHRRTLKRLESRHEDNPSLFDELGNPTEQGLRTLAILDALEGVLHDRLRLGRWVAAEGVVYNFDRRHHLVTTMPTGWESWRKVRSIDFGFNNPFVCLWGALDPDSRLYIYRQLYMTQRTVDRHAVTIKNAERWYLTEQDLPDVDEPTRQQLERDRDHLGVDESTGWIVDKRTGRPIPNPRREKIDSTVADHDAEDRATLQSHGIITLPAKKEISPGIQAVQKRLRKAGDGRPRLFVLENCLIEVDATLAAAHQPFMIEHEFDLYAWPKGADGKPQKEVPVKLYDHAMDGLRYMVRHVDRLGTPLIR